MRPALSWCATALAVAALGLTSGPTSVAAADDNGADGPSDRVTVDFVAEDGLDADEVLEKATEALEGGDKEATLSLRDLFLARDSLEGDELRQADALLARPTDGGSDPFGDGYTTKSKRTCAKHVCVHWVPRTEDAPPSRGWVNTNLNVMEQVWKHHIDKLNYRAPRSDRGRGGNGKFDVYLKELGKFGLYGYCAPERRVPGAPKQASGYCVLDDDFARSQFKRKPIRTLKVTAAHEFFHAIQFAYDFAEDKWLLEATATWMEERYADGVNDNRNYLKFGHIKRPHLQLDYFDPSGLQHYGMWPFFESLSQKYGKGIVRKVTKRTGTGSGLPDDYSLQAVKAVLGNKGGFYANFRSYAGGNALPGRAYSEGNKWPQPAMSANVKLSSSARTLDRAYELNHLAARHVRVKPGWSLGSKAWRIQVRVDGPPLVRAPAAYLSMKWKDGSTRRRAIKLNSNGLGVANANFSNRDIKNATVTIINASTRFQCGNNTTFACTGDPIDQGQPFTVRITTSKQAP